MRLAQPRRTAVLAATALIAGLAAGFAPAGHAAPPAMPGTVTIPYPDGTVVIPPSSIARPEDAGRRAHTNLQLFFPASLNTDAKHPFGRFETPASLACVYGLTAPVPGCNPATATALPTGGSRTIAIVGGYDAPTAAADLAVFSAQFGLPPINADNFQVVYADGQQPKSDPNGLWNLETAIDVEMAHAMAPAAKIILVEARTSALHDLYAAVAVAARLVAAAGGGEVSCSWGGAETGNEEALEATFSGDHVVFIAAAGDEPGTNQPSVLQNVIAAGGTSIARDDDFDFTAEGAWHHTAGGPSRVVPRPAYQDRIATLVGTARGVPDIAFDSDPRTGVWIYDSTKLFLKTHGWLTVGGTSVAAPALAGLINSAGHFAVSSADELAELYGGMNRKTNWTDIRRRKCGAQRVYQAVEGWDFCTGIGSPLGYKGK